MKNVCPHPPSRRRFGAMRNTPNTQNERIDQSLVTGVLPKPGNSEREALDGREVSSICATFGDLDVAATLEAFARGQRALGFGQHTLTSSPTHRLKGTRVGDSVFQRRSGLTSLRQGYGSARRWNLFRLIPPFPHNSAFGGSFLFLAKEGKPDLSARRRFHAGTQGPSGSAFARKLRRDRRGCYPELRSTSSRLGSDKVG
jgi:hypothetical protein